METVKINGHDCVIKQVIQISTNKRGVVVRDQAFDVNTGIAVGPPLNIGTIQFDETMSNAQKVYAYAKTRRWTFDDNEEPNRIGQRTPIDSAPIETDPAEARKAGVGAVASNELVTP
jgi:hypothetical protein